MLQADDTLPEVTHHAAPWDLRGCAWIVALRLPPASAAREAFLPPACAGRGRHPLSVLMYVDYASAPCGPYRELLFVPGAFPFQDGRSHPTISRILVSTWDSVVNGRRNWGIPKDRADFEVTPSARGDSPERVRVTADSGHELCSLRFGLSRWAPRLPLTSRILPASLRVMAQSYGGREYHYAPSARGWMRPGRLLEWRFDAGRMPDLAGARVLGAIWIESFSMRFPVASVEPGNCFQTG